MDDIFFALDDVTHVIQKSDAYQNCLRLKKQMNANTSLLALIEEIKKTQKLYVKSGFQDTSLERILKEKEEKLERIPLYREYMRNLEEVNRMIDTVKEELNSYFNSKFNILK